MAAKAQTRKEGGTEIRNRRRKAKINSEKRLKGNDQVIRQMEGVNMEEA